MSHSNRRRYRGHRMTRIGGHFSCHPPCKWVKGKVIGSGSFGNVHMAMNKSTGALFVVKAAQTESKAALESLKNEADILESLNSPHVVRCLGREVVKRKDGKEEVSIFMEYVAGGSLSDALVNFGGALDEQVIRLYTREILHGLAYLHGNGIVHCDLKCKNVLLGSDGSIKLADFGCSRRLNRSEHSRLSACPWGSSVGGTPLWMAPEVLRNEGLDDKSDMWSLGCTVIEMATGRPPWMSEVSTQKAAIMKIANSTQILQFPKQFSKEGLDFLAKCLGRNPKRRWSAEQLLHHPFVSGDSTSQEAADSPVSVFSFGRYDEESDSDEAEYTAREEFAKKYPFTLNCCWEDPKTGKWRLEDSDSSSLGSWTTVR